MPNTPAAVRQGITVACAAQGVSAAEKKRCQQLLEAVGQALWVDDEALMDPVTALSGSGPAYVFLLVEAMAAAGAKLGLTPDMAMQLARATVAGSGELLKQSSEPAAQILKLTGVASSREQTGCTPRSNKQRSLWRLF